MTEASTVVRRAGLKPTRQRVAIVDLLGDQDRPATAQALHGDLPASTRPGLATIYRTLQALAQAGLAETFPSGGEVAYRLCPPEHHHHLTCERCGSVQEIPSCEVEGWAEAVSRRRGFLLTAHRAELFGLCSRCRKRPTAQVRPRTSS